MNESEKHSDLISPNNTSTKSKRKSLFFPVILVVGLIGVLLSAFFLWSWFNGSTGKFSLGDATFIEDVEGYIIPRDAAFSNSSRADDLEYTAVAIQGVISEVSFDEEDNTCLLIVETENKSWAVTFTSDSSEDILNEIIGKEFYIYGTSLTPLSIDDSSTQLPQLTIKSYNKGDGLYDVSTLEQFTASSFKIPDETIYQTIIPFDNDNQIVISVSQGSDGSLTGICSISFDGTDPYREVALIRMSQVTFLINEIYTYNIFIISDDSAGFLTEDESVFPGLFSLPEHSSIFSTEDVTALFAIYPEDCLVLVNAISDYFDTEATLIYLSGL